MKANPIRKGRAAHFSVNIATGRVRWSRPWTAVCPHCNEVLYAGAATRHSTGARASRKTAKDALYLHIQDHHQPGSVGR